MLDAQEHPAEEWIVRHHERWAEEVNLEEIKTRQRERPVLRSETPAGVVPEIAGLLLAPYMVGVVRREAAKGNELPPRRISFFERYWG